MRCAPESTDYTGRDALQDVGFDVEKTTRFVRSAGIDDASRGQAAGKGLPKPLKRDTSPAPTSGTQNGVEWSGGEEKSQEAAAATSSESGSTVMPWVAAGVIGALAVLIGVTTVRRRRRGGAPSP